LRTGGARVLATRFEKMAAHAPPRSMIRKGSANGPALGAPGPRATEPRSALDFERVVSEHHERVGHVLRRRGVPERDLADAKQEVFLVVHRKLAQFEGRASLATWLHRIAVNVASEHRRRARNRYESLAHDPEAALVAEDPHARLEARDALAAAGHALEAFDASQREALLLYELEGVPMAEVATRTGVPLKTAFSRLYAARRELVRRFGARGCFGLIGFDAWAMRGRSWLQANRTWLSASASPIAQPPLLAVLIALSMLAPHRPQNPRSEWALPATAVNRVRDEHGRARSAASASAQMPGASPLQRTPVTSARRSRTVRPRGATRKRHADAPDAPATSELRAVDMVFAPNDLTVVRLGADAIGPVAKHPWAERRAVDPVSVRPHRMSAADAAGALDAQLPQPTAR
jgi:RNA polymerase sigma-70 factor (ECF subfamily)